MFYEKSFIESEFYQLTMGTTSKSIALVLVALFLITLVTVPSVQPVHAALSWSVQILDKNAAPGGHAPIEVDSNNILHMAYCGTTILHQETLWSNGYATLNGADWIIQERPFGYVTDLKLDADNNPHMLIDPGVYSPLTYAKWTGTEWLTQTIPSTERSVYASLALDLSGNPHVAYTYGEGLQYARWTGSSWDIETVDASYSENAFMLSLVLDKNNRPYILYANSSQYQDYVRAYNLLSVKLAVLKDSGWSIEPVLVNYNFSGCWNMVLDSKGYPHFLATLPQLRTQFSKILYISWDGSTWKTQTVVSEADLDNRGFLALDVQDNPNIVYSTRDNEVIYTYWTGADWKNQTVPTGNLVYVIDGPCYLALDSNGNPHISFRGPMPGQQHWREASILYASATGTKEFTQSPTIQPSSTTTPVFPLPIVAAAVVLVMFIVVVTVGALLFRRHQKLSLVKEDVEANYGY